MFSYTAMRLRQIGEDLEKIKLVTIYSTIEQKVIQFINNSSIKTKSSIKIQILHWAHFGSD